MRIIKASIDASMRKARFADLQLKIESRSIEELQPRSRQTRKHSKGQLEKLADGIRRFGFPVPVLVDEKGVLIAGHARVLAAKLVGMTAVPTLRLTHLCEADKTAFAIFDNRIAELAEWDDEILAVEFKGLLDLDFDIEMTGFELPEIDGILDRATRKADPADSFVEPAGAAISRPGDLWYLGQHRLVCGSALEDSVYRLLMGSESANVVFADPPYNVAIQGNVSGLGKNQHREFAMASGEMSREAFTAFLRTTFQHLVTFSRDGSIHFHCMDWRHMGEVLEAGEGTYTELKNLCVWAKDNGGMGSLYRSRHELVFVFKSGGAPHVNAIDLGRFGRNRTNVWEYPGQNTFHRNRDSELAAHPTVKPIALVADAIRDVSHRNAIVLDPFAGSGTTILAAERSGRQARAIELDPIYVDVAIRRWEELSGTHAVHATTGLRLTELAQTRTGEEVQNVEEN